MNCQQFDQQLNDLLDRRDCPADNSQLRSHAETCAQCRCKMAVWSVMETGHSEASGNVTPHALPENGSPENGSPEPSLSEPSLNDPSLSELSLNEPSLNEPSLVGGGRMIALAGAQKWAIAIAAVVLIWFRWGPAPTTPPNRVAVASANRSAPNQSASMERPSEPLPSSLAMTVEASAANWWQDVQTRDWVGQTMPAVKSMRDGVAPLGRSLMRAVTILAIGGSERTS